MNSPYVNSNRRSKSHSALFVKGKNQIVLQQTCCHSYKKKRCLTLRTAHFAEITREFEEISQQSNQP